MLEATEEAVGECERAAADLRRAVRRAAEAVEASRQRSSARPARESTARMDRREFEAELIVEHQGLARKIASHYYHRGEAADDLDQVAMLALVRAARRWDPDRGIPFYGFAAPSISGELKRHFRDKAWSMRVPRPLQDLHARARVARDELTQRTGRVPTVTEVAEHLGCPEERLLEAMEAGRNFRSASIDKLGQQEAFDLPITDDGFDKLLNRRDLSAALRHLTPIEQRMLHLRFVEDCTQAAIAAEFRCSQMHVSRTLARALAKLRRHMGAAEVVDAPRTRRRRVESPASEAS